ncbi:transglutaminase family protein [Tuwongella immobilis]|uniref:Transglutaminase-like domain-containing protein n=1 Tax=Tuwongella immobilis TaxID=692036 RepID=A0A6C2YPH7_9BACT|nr:transglutaminase family protein [Tuwongella immobilis]VIP03520.1 Transglutaminase domain protein OS=Planctomyces limnophilus (strain ATCC 43296 / DSM 3776 / IFAM 1008 / 290) GN=Plim_1494 PE=4 SV=1: Bact_transglu_N: Transglut_core [Tuwongella immobilis]VTS04408.1 Transglutaminase domain protein OS=Planctomyces limnophilus (strain ATCC 43296 / DSM 3776 / IFAM 1008 / 290) GN=Plim_1494 PE=4 SV=1: Bact_transglu_N: Transglut_core [Tuwongella immobilis]
MRYMIRHTTIYRYAAPVGGCHNLVHLTPRNDRNQRLLFCDLLVTPMPETVTRFTDFFGNDVTFFSIHEPHDQLQVTALSRVAVDRTDRGDLSASLPWEQVTQYVRNANSREGLDAFQYLYDSPFVKANPLLLDYTRESFKPGRALLAAVWDLNHRIFKDFKYSPMTTTLATPVEEVFRSRRGVCQDFAHLMIACMRSIGIAARYVSGYLRTTPAKDSRGNLLIGADASHAWVSVFDPHRGWVDFDPTNDLMPSDQHITLGWGRDYDDVSPIKGVILGGGQHRLEVGVEVKPVEV